MKCSSCGFETQSTAKFCVQCGSTLPAIGPAAGSTNVVPPPAPAQAPAQAQASVTGVNRAASQTSISGAAATMQRPATTISSPPPASPPPVRPTVVGPPRGCVGLWRSDIVAHGHNRRRCRGGRAAVRRRIFRLSRAVRRGYYGRKRGQREVGAAAGAGQGFERDYVYACGSRAAIGRHDTGLARVACGERFGCAGSYRR